jgi:serine/threonine-protein kinase
MIGDEDETPPPASGEDRTVFSPATGFAAVPPPPPPAPSGGFGSAPGSGQGFAPPPAPASNEPRRIQVGDVLNHIFEVRRFIGRGGMGEVFEGINVNSEERVAIKGILPHLAADEAVIAMFRKEAKTLTRLSHPALVQYRVLAQEPQIGVFYIVTEFIEGQNLNDILREINATPADLAMLTKRLAEGLAAAHSLGAIHRDISPDNVMLEAGKLDLAKVIDFGIAKDLDASSATIVGDGFAGKLNYVAPEQLGDFDRAVGPWTDVYSLGLTMLAVARGKDVDMGGTLVDAVDKRRAGPDLSPIPEGLRPVFEKMLKANPAERVRSMGEVIQLLADPSLASAPGASAGGAAKTSKPAKAKAEPGAGLGGLAANKAVLIGGGLGAVVLAGVLYAVFSGGSEESDTAEGPATEVAAAVGDPAATARQAIAAGLPSVPCTWLDLIDAQANGTSVTLSFRGVAGKPAEAQGQIGKLLTAKGLQAGSIDFSDVSPINPGDCGPLEAFRQIRAPAASKLSVAQRQFEMVKLGTEFGPDAGKIAAPAVIQVNTNADTKDLSLVGMDDSGSMTKLIGARTELSPANGIEQPQPGVYRFQLNTDHKGWSGILLLSGQGPFDDALLNGTTASRGADWANRFLTQARQKGWQAEMVWYRTVDAAPN